MTEEDKVVVTKTTEEEQDSAPSQDKKPKRSKEETTEFNLKRLADEAKELGIDPAKVLGLDAKSSQEDEDGDVPAWFKKHQQDLAKKTALEMADGLPDDDTKAKVKEYLSTRIVPSENPHEDFRLALAAASAPKNKQIAEEINRWSKPRVTASGGSASKPAEEEFVPTAEEAMMMAKPYNVSKEKIVALRRKQG